MEDFSAGFSELHSLGQEESCEEIFLGDNLGVSRFFGHRLMKFRILTERFSEMF